MVTLSIWTLLMSNTNTKGWFCSLLFNHIYSEATGQWTPCCRSKPQFANITRTVYDTTPMEWFNSPEMNEYRKMTLNGEVPNVCIRCKNDEDAGITSYRQRSNQKPWTEDVIDIAERFRKTGELTLDKRVLHVKMKVFGNYCNLKCFMCHPKNSSSRQSELIKMSKHYDYDFLRKMEQEKDPSPSIEKTVTFNEIIEETVKIAPYIATLEIIGGEPLMMKSHYDLLDRLIEEDEAKDMELFYVSNITRLQYQGKNFLDYVNKFKQIRLVVSLDGIFEQVEWIRWGLNWDEFIENLNILKQYDNIKLSISFTCSVLSVFQATEMYDYFMFEQKVHTDMDVNIVSSPKWLDPRHLPDDIKDKLIADMESHPRKNEFISIINALKQERDEGLFNIGMKYIRSLKDYRNSNKLNVSELFPEVGKYIDNAELDFENDPEYRMSKMG